MKQFREKRKAARQSHEQCLDIVRITGSRFDIKGLLVDISAQGASFLSPVGLHHGEIVTIRRRAVPDRSTADAAPSGSSPPFQMVTCEVVHCEEACLSGDFKYKVGAKLLLSYF
jgi:hypothetical protein